MPRYERILPLVAIVLMGLGLILLVEGINTLTFSIPLPGELEASVSIAWLILFFLLIVVVVGTESVQYEEAETELVTGRARRLHPATWIVPVLLTLTSFLFLRLLQSLVVRAVGLGITGGLLVAALVGQHYARQERPHGREWGQRSLALLIYVLAFFLYGAIYTLKVRSLFSATSLVVLTFLLAWALLYRLAPWSQVRLYAAIVGLCVGEATWPLNYWAINGIVGGAFLLVLFYVLVNPVRHHLQGTLTWRVAREYVIVVLVALLLLAAHVFGLLGPAFGRRW
jgi:hypothetical protein